jgi:hypothetical protein
MANGNPRINAVIAALEKIREHVDTMPEDSELDAETYNRWIGMLDGVVDGNWKSLALTDGVLTASEMLMHVDAAVAFLSAHKA